APFWGRPYSLLKAPTRNTASGKSTGCPDRASTRRALFDGGITMYAVIRAGGKQYRVAPGDVIRVESQGNGTHGQVEFGDVLAVSSGEGQIGKPQSGARVVGEVVEHGRGDKILVFHYKRKKQYKKLRGHRQNYSAVRITEIAFDGQSFKAPELVKKEKKVKEHEGGVEVKTSKRPGKKATKHVAHPHAKKAAPKKKAAKKGKK